MASQSRLRGPWRGARIGVLRGRRATRLRFLLCASPAVGQASAMASAIAETRIFIIASIKASCRRRRRAQHDHGRSDRDPSRCSPISTDERTRSCPGPRCARPRGTLHIVLRGRLAACLRLLALCFADVGHASAMASATIDTSAFMTPRLASTQSSPPSPAPAWRECSDRDPSRRIPTKLAGAGSALGAGRVSRARRLLALRRLLLRGRAAARRRFLALGLADTRPRERDGERHRRN